MIYVDTNVFVYAALNLKDISGDCLRIMDKIANNEIDVCTSVLTWDEFYYSVKKSLGADYAKSAGQRFLDLVNLEFLNANFDVVSLAQKLIERYNLGPRNAIHAATAITNGCKEIVSDDSDFDKVKELKRIKIK
jgi:predicted nucleic acid-binding protein